jgi:hypothetical protein
MGKRLRRKPVKKDRTKAETVNHPPPTDEESNIEIEFIPESLDPLLLASGEFDLTRFTAVKEDEDTLPILDQHDPMDMDSEDDEGDEGADGKGPSLRKEKRLNRLTVGMLYAHCTYSSPTEATGQKAGYG